MIKLDIIMANNKGIEKMIMTVDAVVEKVALSDCDSKYIEIIDDCLNAIKGSLYANAKIVEGVIEELDEKDAEIEMLNEEIENLNKSINSLFTDDKYITKRNTIKYTQTKERFMQVHKEYLETGVKPYILCKKYHMCPSTYYKYLEKFKKGELK